MRLNAGLALALSFGSLIAIATACSSSDPAPPATAADAGAGDGGSGGTVQCGTTSTTFTECLLCCGIPESYIESQQALGDCLCDGPCKDVCATTGCSSEPDAGEPTADCDACLKSDTNGQTCFPKAKAVCDADQACKDFTVCRNTSKCEDKPD